MTTSHEQTVEGMVQVHSMIARLRVHIFLSGLDSAYDQVCGEILRKDPKLDLEGTYASGESINKDKQWEILDESRRVRLC